MSKKNLGLLLIVGGLILLVLSLGADIFGIGAEAGFGWKQLTGTVVGLAAFGYGFWMTRVKPEKKK